MPSPLHEALVALFRNRPSLATELVSDVLGLALPPHDGVADGSAKLEATAPVEYAADHVVKLVRDTATVAAIVVEVQLGIDPDKRRTWPHYLSGLRATLGCPCWLLVVAPRRAVASWAAKPIDLGHPGFTLTPLVVGPSAVPLATTAEQARVAAVELAVLSAIAHGKGRRGFEVGRATLEAIARGASLDEEQSRIYTDIVMASLGEAARRALEELMSTGGYEYQSEFARKYVAQGKAEGKAEGKADALLAVLQARGLDVPAALEERVRACRDLEQLDRWITRAVSVAQADEIFG